MGNNRIEIGEELLEAVNGGKIEYTWDNDNGGSGTIWITSKKAPRVYKFTNYGVVDYVSRKQNEGYSDPEIFELLTEKNLIW